MVRSRAFQLTAEEARAAPDVVTGMFVTINFYFMLISILIFYVFVLGPFHVNDIPVLVLFDLGTT